MKCDNCDDVIDDYYYTISGFVVKTCSISCMAEILCNSNVENIKVHLDAAKKKVIKFRAI